MLLLDRLPARAAVCAAGLALVAGCGGGEEPAGRSATVGAGEPVTVVATEYAFDPATLAVEGGGDLEIELDNQGALAHNLRVFDGVEEVGGTPTFQGGEARTATVPLDPGTYRLICTVANHEQLGMVGELEVR